MLVVMYVFQVTGPLTLSPLVMTSKTMTENYIFVGHTPAADKMEL